MTSKIIYKLCLQLCNNYQKNKENVLNQSNIKILC